MMIWWAQLGQVAQHTLQIFIGSSNQLQGKYVLLLINSCLTGKPYDIYREKCKLMICMQYRTLPGKKCIHCKCFLHEKYWDFQSFTWILAKMHLILISLFSNYMHFTGLWVKHRESLYFLWRKHLQCTYKFYQEEYCIAYKISLNHFPTWNLWRENSNSNGFHSEFSHSFLEKRWKVLLGQIITLCFLIGVCELKVRGSSSKQKLC